MMYHSTHSMITYDSRFRVDKKEQKSKKKR